MRGKRLKALSASLIVGLVAVVILSAIPGLAAAYTPPKGETRQEGLTLIVGGQDEMKTRNLWPTIANDVWTSDVHFRVWAGAGPLLPHPTLDRPMAYMAKGTDFDEDGRFEDAEYDVWAETATAAPCLEADPCEITVYYDFNGVRWHDGVQVNVWDLLFSYHVTSLVSRFTTDQRYIWARGPASTFDAGGRQMNITIVDTDGDPTNGYQKNWDGESNLLGDDNLRVGLTFAMGRPFAFFYDSILAPVLVPMHQWSITGGGRHADFGCAVWLPSSVATAKGIDACGTTTTTKWGIGIAATEPVPGSRPYQMTGPTGAESWAMADADVIGSGPFRFGRWVSGVEANVVRNDDYFTGVDAATGDVLDARLAAILKAPVIDGIRYKVYRTTQLGVFALQSGEVDFYHWNVGAEFVPDLLKIPEIAVESNAEPGYFYLAYNMRKSPWGYENNDPSRDIGLAFRTAVAHVVDKKSIVQNLLQNFGVVAPGPVSPQTTFWYYDNIPKPRFDLAQARAILDDAATPGGQYYVPGLSLDPGSTTDCNKDNDAGCRTLPRIGNADFEILTPQADYDPVRASAGAMVAQAMRDVGINAVSKPTAFGAITATIGDVTKPFDLFILGWRIGSPDPDYLYSFFHSANAATGQNYPGFNNAAFDATMEDSREALDRETRRTLLNQAQVIIAENRPNEVLYFRTNIEGYRQDRYVGWSVVAGTIWNFWSIQTIHPPSQASMTVTVSAVSAMSASGTETVEVRVLDNTGQALQGASVNLTVTSIPAGQEGNLTYGTARGLYVVGSTDLNGEFTASYQADPITAETKVIFGAEVAHPTYGTVQRSSETTVFPAGTAFLSLLLELPAGDRVTAGSTLPLRIDVRDQDRAPVPDAQVSILVAPAGQVTPNPLSGDAVDMSAVVLATTAASTAGAYTVTVTATKDPMVPGEDELTVTVAAATGGTKLCPDGRRYPVAQDCPSVSTPGLEVLPILAGIGIAALVAGVAAERRRRS